jgi:ubiquinone/menaquinone biosynthesis C-methylase UbiE
MNADFEGFREFRDFEHHGWQQVAARYHGSFATATVQAVVSLLDAAGVGEGMRVLDVACGPGYVAAAAAGRGAAVLGIDFSSEMVAEARRLFPSIDFQEGDAEELTLPDRGFDAVVMNFGMLHLGRPHRATAEAYRVLREGRFAFSVWDTPDRTVGFGIVLDAIRKHGDLNAPIPPGPPFFRFSDPVESTRLLSEAGFRDIRIAHVEQTWRFPTRDMLFDVMLNASVRNAALLRAQRPEILSKIRETVRSAVEQHRTPTGFELPMPAVLFSAARR